MAQKSFKSPSGSSQRTAPVRTTNRTTNGKPSSQASTTKLSDDPPTALFAHLPPYSPPQTPLFKRLPKALIPYAELMRLHKPAGYYAFLFPHLTGTLLAASQGPITPSLPLLVRIIISQVIANVFLRGAACTYNDALDGPFDRLVERCRHRPVARGAVSPFAGHVFAVAQALIWLAIMVTLPPETTKPTMVLGATMLLYPWCKRFTNYPQVVLGFSLASGQGIGMGVVGWDIQEEKDSWKLWGIGALYLASVLNAIVYDTVYAHQDLQDDLKAGVKSMAIACMGWTKQWLGLLSSLEVILLAFTGYAMGLGGLYWLLSVGGTAGVLGWMLKVWKIEDPTDSWYWFCHLIWFTGGTVCAGLAGEYIQQM